jgi:hypothetical protein
LVPQQIAIVLAGGRKILAAFLCGASPLDIARFSAGAGVFVLTGLAVCFAPAMEPAPSIRSKRSSLNNPLLRRPPLRFDQFGHQHCYGLQREYAASSLRTPTLAVSPL